MDMGLVGRSALVTGASGAIGAAIARSLAGEGVRVGVGFHRNEAGAGRLCADLVAAGAAAAPVGLDLGDTAAVGEALARAQAALGAPVTVLVANAVHWPAEPTAEQGLAAGLRLNVAGTLSLVEAALPAMRAAGWGRIVLVSTDVVRQPMAGPLAYPAAKGALEAAARALAVREGAAGVLTNVVRPGFTRTERALTAPWLGQAVIDAEAARTPTGRISTPEDVASAVTYLASAGNGHVNGQVLSVSGGRELMR